VDSTLAMVVTSAMVIGFHLADLFAHRMRIPSVLLLMGLGTAGSIIATRYLDGFQISKEMLTGLGLLGLALIVLEGALGLVWRSGSERTMIRASVASILGLGLFLVPASLAFHVVWSVPWRLAVLNSIPLAVISSAIAIPSASRLSETFREFVSVESSLSDILAVLVFNAVAIPGALGLRTLFHMGWSAALVAVVSLAVVAGTLRIMRHGSQGVRFIPLLASLLLFFSLGKMLHMPSLLLVFLFGLAVANLPQLRIGWVQRLLMHDGFRQDSHLLETMVRELAFLARTFFFFLFGYSLDFASLADPVPWVVGIALLFLVYASRYLTLRPLLGTRIRGVLFIAPRGLITILLFGMIPANERIGGVATGAVLLVVLGTTLAQMFGGKAVSAAAGMPDLAEILPIGPRRPEE
jgi:potassium/hydrogen antiporter